MFLTPKKSKFRKHHKGRIHGIAKNGFSLAFGSYGLKAIEPARITSRQIEASRKAIMRTMKRLGKLWIRVFPDIIVTRKPAEVRMGSGKGSPEFHIARIRPGKIIFEIDGISEEIAQEALAKAAAKMPMKTKFIKILED